MKTASERLEKIMNDKGLNAKKFSEAIGLNRPQAIYDIMNGKTANISNTMAVKIVSVFPDINKTWLLTGDGESTERPIIGTEKGKPYYNVPFKMGYDLPYNDNISNPDYLVDFAPFNNCDFWCNAAGYSMYPTIASGDLVAFKVINDFSYLINNEIYGIVLKNGLRTIKRVKEKGNVFLLIPDNKEYDEQEVLKEDVLAIFRVMGTVKVF